MLDYLKNGYAVLCVGHVLYSNGSWLGPSRPHNFYIEELVFLSTHSFLQNTYSK